MTEQQKERSAAQLEILAKAREKAKLVRAENAKLKAQEKEIAKMEKEKDKEDRKAKVNAKMKELKPEPKEELKEEEYVAEESSDEEVEQVVRKVVKKTKPKPKKKPKKIVYIEGTESESSEDEHVVMVKKSKPKRRVVHSHIPTDEPPAPPPTLQPQMSQSQMYFEKFFNH